MHASKYKRIVRTLKIPVKFLRILDQDHKTFRVSIEKLSS